MYRLHVAAMLQRWRSLPNADAHLRELWRALERDALEDRSHIDWAPNRTDEEWYWVSWAPVETQATALLARMLEARPLATELFGSPATLRATGGQDRRRGSRSATATVAGTPAATPRWQWRRCWSIACATSAIRTVRAHMRCG
jgi:hypothetical protein